MLKQIPTKDDPLKLCVEEVLESNSEALMAIDRKKMAEDRLIKELIKQGYSHCLTVKYSAVRRLLNRTK